MRKVFAICIFQLLVLSLKAQQVSPFYEDGNLYLSFKKGSLAFTGSVSTDSLMAASALGDFGKLFPVAAMRRPFSFAKHQGLENIVKISLQNHLDVDRALSYLAKLSNLEYAEKVPLKRFYFAAPNDTDYNISQQWSLFKINSLLAWSYVTPGSNVKIAIVDDGMDISHPDIAANVWVNPGEIPGNGLDDDGNFFADDLNGWDFGQGDNDPNPQSLSWEHGTHVSGIASAVTNNTTGIASIGYNAKLMPVKATNSNLYVSHGYESIVYAADNAADVINLSWGGPAYSATEQNVLYYAHNLNCFVVSASGNDGNVTVNYPAGYDYVFSVAATGPNDVVTFNSNRGPWIDIAAPGINIYSTKPGNTYGLLTGTSMASPLVAGMAALMKSFNPMLTTTQIEHCIRSSADNIDFMNPFLVGQLGAGRINAYLAMSCVSATRNQIDLAIDSLVYPNRYACSGLVEPHLKIRNAGTDTITQFKLRYSIDNQPFQLVDLNVSLPYDSAFTYALPAQGLGSGEHTITAYVSWPNGIIDWNLFNDTLIQKFTILTAGLPLPFFENFSDTSASVDLWRMANNDGLVGWTMKEFFVQGNLERSAFINLFNDQNIGQRDGLISPPFNLSGLDSAWLSFDAAYQKNYNRPFDSLLVMVSTDCGMSFPHRVFAMPGPGLEWPTSDDTTATYFEADLQNFWCDSLNTQNGCYYVDLTDFIGNPSVVVQFQTFNQYGNNVYLDNVNVKGLPAVQAAPTVTFTADNQEICPGTMINFSYTGSSANNFQWTFTGGNPAVSNLQNVSVVYPNAGNFNVSLTAANGSNSSTANQNNFITVNPLPATQILGGIADTLLCLGDSMILTASGALTYTWNSNGLFPELLQNSVILNGQTAGLYDVWVRGISVDGCFALDSVQIEITSCLGMMDRDLSASFLYFADENLVLEWAGLESARAQIKIFSVNGALVSAQSLLVVNGKNTISSINHLRPGVYMVQINTESGESKHQKMVKLR
jgi:PKD repeat protein